MRIAVIGGGFYGIMASLEAAKKKYVNEVNLFEKNSSLMQAAGKYNQARLHLGFHYPRSEETICQSKSGFIFYQNRLPQATKSINKNIYIIRDDGLVSIDEYLKIMDKNKLKYKDINLKDSAFKYKSDEVKYKSIQVEERCIDLLKLNKNLLRELEEMDVKVFLNQEVINIDTEKGKLDFKNGNLGKYDLIVNCSYTNPFIGFKRNKVPLKYELCTLLLVTSDKLKNQAVTVMDGPFVSIYPWLSNLHSVASVKFSPTIQTESLTEFLNQYKQRTLYENEKSILSIENHMKSLFEFDYTYVGNFSTAKVKLRDDKGDKRLVKTFSEGKCISVLQGKLDAVNFFLDDLLIRINELR